MTSSSVGTCCSEGVAMPDAMRVVTFCNENYLSLLDNFCAAPGAPAREAMIVYALDYVTLERASHLGIESRKLDWDGDLASLWTTRTRKFAQLINDGVSFIHTDLDAVWLRDPLAHLFSGDQDMIFSQGTIWPPECHARLGFVLCCGLFAMRPGEASSKFLELMVDDLHRTGDDQVSLNALLMTHETAWPGWLSPDYRLPFEGGKFSCWSKPLDGVCEALDLRVRMIPHRDAMRIKDCTALDPYVFHPLSPKQSEQKLRMFADLGLRFEL